MIKLKIKSGAELDANPGSYGIGRTYLNIVNQFKKMNEFELVDDFRKADVQLTLTYPGEEWEFVHWWARDRHPVDIIYTAWETTVPPVSWVKTINTYQALFVEANWSKNVFQNAGVDIPAYVTPAGVDPEHFTFHERDWDSENFNFLWQGMNSNDRKGYEYAKKGFQKANIPNSWLWIKIYPKRSRSGIVHFEEQRITEIRAILPQNQYDEFLKRCHCAVYPFRGEGFGLMPLESLANGMHVMLTGWSGPTEYIDDRYFRSLKYQMSEPGRDYINSSIYVSHETTLGQDAVPDVNDIADAMWETYENRHKIAETRKEASDWVIENWSAEKAAQKLADAIEDVLMNQRGL